MSLRARSASVIASLRCNAPAGEQRPPQPAGAIPFCYLLWRRARFSCSWRDFSSTPFASFSL